MPTAQNARTDWACPDCGSDDTEINTHEAWCFACDWHITKTSDPQTFTRLRDNELGRRGNPRMDPGELRTVREYLGLTLDALAGILAVRLDTLRRWESGRERIPYRVREEVEKVEADTAAAVGELVAALQDAADPAVLVYPSDEAMHLARLGTEHLTARWWRHVVARAAGEVPGVVIRSATKTGEAPED